MNKELKINKDEYGNILLQAVEQIRRARAALARQIVSTTQSVYWNLGKLLFEKQLAEGYGSSVVKQLSIDLKTEFPDMGLSPRNLWNMKRFYERYYSADEKLLRSVAVLPWYQNLLLLDKVKSLEAVEFYANEAITKNWSRDLLLNAIKMDIYGNTKKQLKTNNFADTLTADSADYANEVFKDSYNLGFLGITEPIKELELEIGSFKAEYAGKMNLYLSLLDKLEKGETENQSIGIILCADRDHLDVEIALQDINKPIGVAEYQLLLPKDELQALLIDEMKKSK